MVISAGNPSFNLMLLCFLSILKELGIDKGSAVPNRDKVGKLTKSQVNKIAEIKGPDLRVSSKEAAANVVAGTARSMGVDIVEG